MKARTIAIGLIAGAICGFAGWHSWRAGDSALAAAAAGQAAEAPEVPVGTAAAKIQDVPEYLAGLGTVQALRVVQIKAQVNGTLIALPAHEGQEVHEGDIVAEIDPRPYQAALDQATAMRQGDQAQLVSAQLDLQRYAALAQKQFAPVQQVDDQRATVNKLVASVAADSAAIETAELNLQYCVIRSPIDGRVSLYQVDVGNLIEVSSQTSGIISITQDKPIAMVFTLPEADLARVQDARSRGVVPVLVSGGMDDEKVIATGTLLTPNNTIDTTTGTISLKATFPNDDDHLWPGQFVHARVLVDILHDAVTVPTLAVQHGPDGLFVYTVKPDDTVAQTVVKVGYQDNGQSVVTSGLTGTETVVVSGQSRLSPGTKVKANAPPASDAAADGRPSTNG
jgi:multidrug efflux system membrane fusion protein